MDAAAAAFAAACWRRFICLRLREASPSATSAAAAAAAEASTAAESGLIPTPHWPQLYGAALRPPRKAGAASASLLYKRGPPQAGRFGPANRRAHGPRPHRRPGAGKRPRALQRPHAGDSRPGPRAQISAFSEICRLRNLQIWLNAEISAFSG